MPAFLYKEGRKGGEENIHICQHMDGLSLDGNTE